MIVEVRERRRARRRVAAVGEAVREVAAAARAPRRSRRSRRCRAERQVAAGDALRERHEVGIEIPEARREPGAEAAEAGDHLVGDEEDVVAPAKLAQLPQVAGRAARSRRRRPAPARRTAPRWSRRPRARSLRSVSARHHSPYASCAIDWSAPVRVRARHLHEARQRQVEGIGAARQAREARRRERRRRGRRTCGRGSSSSRGRPRSF